MPLTSYSMVSFDVDGTLFRRAALTTAAQALGIGERWNTYDKMYHQKRITLRECLDQQYKLLAGMRVQDILREVVKVETIAGIRETVVKLQGHGLGVTLLTDNPDFLCAYLVESFGFNGYAASKVSVRNGRISDDVQSMPDKRDALRKYCSWVSISVKKCIHVGDWINDVPVFRVVGHSIALNSKSEKVRRVASKALDTDNLLEVYHYLLSLGTEPQPNQ